MAREVDCSGEILCVCVFFTLLCAPVGILAKWK